MRSSCGLAPHLIRSQLAGEEAEVPLFKPGQVLGDHEIVKKIRSGGMATLYLGRRIGAAGFSRPVAIKVVHPHLSEDPRFVSMFVDEALLCARIDHPNVVRVDELAEKDGNYYLVMEYVQGCSLATFIRIIRDTKRRIAPELAVAIAIKIAAGLDAAHELVLDDGRPAGVVHRDVTPSNVLLGYRGEVKLIDFGIAKAADRAQATRTGTLKGKVSYMSPEQAFGRDVDRRTDIYALGILLWEQIAMRRLFRGANDLAILEQVRRPTITAPSHFAPDVPKDLDRVIMRALSAVPDTRPPTARALREQLVNAVPQSMMLDAPQIAGVVRAVLADGGPGDRASIPTNIVTNPGSDEARSSVVSQLILPQTNPGHHPSEVAFAPTVGAPATLLHADEAQSEAPLKRWPLALGCVAAFVGLAAFGVVGAVALNRGDPVVTELEAPPAAVAEPASGEPDETSTPPVSPFENPFASSSPADPEPADPEDAEQEPEPVIADAADPAEEAPTVEEDPPPTRRAGMRRPRASMRPAARMTMTAAARPTAMMRPGMRLIVDDVVF